MSSSTQNPAQGDKNMAKLIYIDEMSGDDLLVLLCDVKSPARIKRLLNGYGPEFMDYDCQKAYHDDRAKPTVDQLLANPPQDPDLEPPFIVTDNNFLSVMIDYELGDLDDEQVITLFQYIHDNGKAEHLQGHYGRTLNYLIGVGYVR
jgi:hypothetical protein